MWMSVLATQQVWADSPMSYLRTFGPAGDPLTQLNWRLTAISIAVTVIIGLLLLLGIFRKRPPLAPDAQGHLPLGRGRGGMQWIYIGTAITVVVLLLSMVWNTLTLAAVNAAPGKPAMTIKVIAHQWWWELQYSGDSNQFFTTANEIHIPVGQPVLFQLSSHDVIHSFWIPKLGGKTDVIPGQVNEAWLQADQAGLYRGQCTEYCGAQHAHMALHLVAQEQAAFDAWQHAQQQSAPAEPFKTQRVAKGAQAFAGHCAVCHTVRGNEAFGKLGPDLTHLMSRHMIGAGSLKNTETNLKAWILNPQAFKPGSRMPGIPLQTEELQAVVAYLETLK